jgi:precorrin-6Y C5,15-methyltransferase (decarboxylating)
MSMERFMGTDFSGLPESSADNAPPAPWLSIIGIGEDGVSGLGDRARQAVSQAAVVFGGKRHLELAASIITGDARPWPVPFDIEMRSVLAERGKKICVLASGDPLLFGVGVTLLRQLPREEVVTLPAPSAFSLAASRLAWPLQSVECVSLHGRPLDLVRPYLHAGTKIIVLTSDAAGPASLAALLSEAGFGASRFILLEALGGAKECIRETQAANFAFDDVNALNVVAVEIAAADRARVFSLASGLDDGLFEHDGQITKREIRAVTLSALAPKRGELLWDIGAGSGSIGIEWMLAHHSLRAIAIEANAERAARIRRNASAFGVPFLKIVEGTAPAAFAGLPQPDAIFIGGGGSEAGVLDAALAALAVGGRLVANAVTLEMEAVLLAAQARLGGSLIRLEVSRASPVGQMQGWRPAMPVTQWSWIKTAEIIS